MDNKRIHIICLGFFIVIGVYTVTSISSSLVPKFIILLLIYLLNFQIRNLLLKGNLILLSLFGELIIVYFISKSYDGLTYLLLLNTLVYEVTNFEKYTYILSVLSFATYLYLLRNQSMEYIVLNILIYAGIWIVLIELKKTSNKVREFEHLYDDVRRYSYELENAKKQVLAYSKRVEELTQMEERNRISAEIHDTIGHRLTALLIQMEAGIRVLELDVLKGKELLIESRDNLRESIDVLRETVRGIRPKEYRSLVASMEDMITEFKKSTKVDINLKISGNPTKLYPGVELVLYKNLQEALTNSVKHGKAHNIDIFLKYLDNSIELMVKDDGLGCYNFKKGMGITNMEERVKFVGGDIEFFSSEGFTVECRIPINS